MDAEWTEIPPTSGALQVPTTLGISSFPLLRISCAKLFLPSCSEIRIQARQFFVERDTGKGKHVLFGKT
jgi:hypothetical protein